MPHVLFKYGTCVLIVYFYNSMSKKKKKMFSSTYLTGNSGSLCARLLTVVSMHGIRINGFIFTNYTF